jgi:uncharacterized repeat protein (TIGR03806 family)
MDLKTANTPGLFSSAVAYCAHCAYGLVLMVAACGNDAGPTGPAGGGASNATAGTSGAPSMSGAAGSVSNAAGAGGSGGTTSDGGGGNTSAGNAGSAGAAGATDVGNCTPPVDVFSPIVKLSKTGCVDPAHPTKPSAQAVTYEVNSPLWSDAADKTRAFVLPAGGKIHVRDCQANAADCPNGNADDGRWDFPVGSVMIKTFAFDDKLVETRLFMRVDASDWVGYSYQWDEAQTEATLVSSDGAQSMFDTGTRTVSWHFPSQKDCLNCHNTAGGSTLGPETAQMNRMVGGANQIDKMTALFEAPPAKPYKDALVAPYPSQAGTPPVTATTEQKARSYLHANCGFCHRPGGNYANFDFRYDTPYKDMKLCNATAQKGAIANAPGKTMILVPGKETDSVMWLRMNEADPEKGRMPQIGSWVADADGTSLVGDWIKSLPATCP